MAHGLSCSTACRIFPDKGSNLGPPALAGGFFTTESPGKPNKTKQDLFKVCPLKGLINYIQILDTSY